MFNQPQAASLPRQTHLGEHGLRDLSPGAWKPVLVVLSTLLGTLVLANLDEFSENFQRGVFPIPIFVADFCYYKRSVGHEFMFKKQ